jgi:biopolymer transport protein ExbD
MRTPSTPRSKQVKFNIISMIDIFFLLIIFFITATRFVHSEAQQGVQLAQAASSVDEDETRAARLMIVTIMADRSMLIGLEKVDLATVEQRIELGRKDNPDEFEVRIRADRNVPYGDIEPILLACARAGVTNVKFPVFAK